MDIARLGADVTSLHWWITAVFLALILDILSSYAKPWLDKWYGSWSAKKKDLNEMQAIEFEVAVDKLSADPLLIILVALSEIKHGVLFLLGIFVMFGTSGLTVLVSTCRYRRGSSSCSLLYCLGYLS